MESLHGVIYLLAIGLPVKSMPGGVTTFFFSSGLLMLEMICVVKHECISLKL